MLHCRASIDTNSDAGKNQAQDLLDELNQKIESAGVKAQEPYDLEKSLDFLSAKKDFQVWTGNILILNWIKR